MLSVSGEYGIVNQIEFQGRSFAGESVAEYHVVETNDIVYTKSPLKANPYGIIKVNNGAPGIVSTLYAVYHPCEGTVAEYIDYYFGNDLRLNKYLKPLVNIGAKHDMKVNNETVLTGEVYFPDYSEQKKIVSFLAILDERIRQQRNLVEALKKYKRGLLRDIFSKLNVRQDKRKLKDVAVLFADGDWIESKDQAPEGIRLVQTGNVGFGVYLDKPQNAKYISEATFHRLNCLEIYDGDILISRLPEPAGRACLLPQSTERRITAVDCTVIRTDKSVIDRTYLLQFLCSDQYIKTVNSFLAGGTRQRISRKNLEGIEVPYPSIDQQRYYGSFLCKVDARISNEKIRLNCLSILRSSLLQQLFI